MANTTLVIIGIAVLSVGTYLMRFGGARLGNKLALSERARRCYPMRRPRYCSPWRWRQRCMKANISPVWPACWG
jgi:hypothetical protein